MSKRGSADVGFLLIDGYDVLGLTTTLTDTVEAMIEDVTALGDSYVSHASVGLKTGEITQDGFYDDASDSINDALCEKSGTSRIICYGLEGNTTGAGLIAFSGAMQGKYTRKATRGELHKASATYSINGAVEEGEIIHTHTSRTDSGDTESDPVEASAQTTDGGAGYLQLSELDLDGATDLTIAIRHSSDDITYEDLLTFTAVDEAPAVERVTVSGTVKKYLAVSYTFDGGTDPSAKFMVGFKRN